MNKQIQKAVTILGGQTSCACELAKYTGVRITQGNVWSWMHRTETVPANLAPYLEELTSQKGERVPKEELCPDFPWDKCCGKDCQERVFA